MEVSFEGKPVQVLNETRVPIAATKRHAQRADYEYERAGTATMFMSPNRDPAGDTSAFANSAPKSTGSSKSTTPAPNESPLTLES